MDSSCVRCGRFSGTRQAWAATRRRVVVTSMAVGVSLGLARPTDASNDALLRLLRVLRDRGSITAAEYDEIRQVAEVSDGAPVPVATPPIAPAASKPSLETDVPPLVNKALAGKWYEKVSLRGYTQFRYTDVVTSQGPSLDVPADRSVNSNESFIIRRGRFVFTGNPSSRLMYYAQMDFNGSTGAADYSLQMRDLYADLALDAKKAWRVRLGQSKVPFGFVNMQSSQNRAPFERPEALNSAVEGERDLGAALMWASPEARRRFADLVSSGVKGSGDYGVVAVGAYSGQGLNRADQNGDVHLFGRVTYPFKLADGQFVEVALQGYRGRFVSPLQAISAGGRVFTPVQRADGEVDERVAATFVWYPQPVGVEAEWTVGRGPALSRDARSVERDDLHGGYVQLHYRHQSPRTGTWFPFTRWNYFDGARKFARNAPRQRVNELDFGLEFGRWAEFEVTGMYTRTFTRTNTTIYPYESTTGGHRLGVQVQWNY